MSEITTGTKVAIVIDDHPVTHFGCRRLLTRAGFDEILEAQDGPGALRQIDRRTPDFAVVDLGLPGIGGLQLIRMILDRAPDCRILVFSMNENAVFAAQALEAGASGYLSKNAAPERFIEAVAEIKRGKTFLERQTAIQVATLRTRQDQTPLSNLTPRELQVLRLIGLGSSYGEIAKEINVSYRTVANTAAILKTKLSARSLADLTRISVTKLLEYAKDE